MSKTFDEELREILNGPVENPDFYWDADDLEAAVSRVKSLIKKHQPEPIQHRAVSPSEDISPSLRTMMETKYPENSYNQALADSDKAYGIKEEK